MVGDEFERFVRAFGSSRASATDVELPSVGCGLGVGEYISSNTSSSSARTASITSRILRIGLIGRDQVLGDTEVGIAI